MTDQRKIVLFMFAGRQANMEVQWPYIERLLADWPNLEVHLWDLTRTPEDQKYLQTITGLETGRVRLLGHLHTGHPIKCTAPMLRTRRMRCECLIHKPPYEEPYKWYASHAEEETVYVKVDDDVLFLETDRFADLIDPLITHPERIISANVINNAVCAKYQPEMQGWFEGVFGDPALPSNDRRWWSLHTEAEFARECHEWFLNGYSVAGQSPASGGYVRTRPGEQISINCIAFTHQTMRWLANVMSDKVGDEGAVDLRLPWIARSFHAAHLAFGPQEKDLDLTDLRNRYAFLAGYYLSSTERSTT